jgi:hypothetical protein
MVMHYHSGLATGHTYAHHRSPSKISALRHSEASLVASDGDEPDEPNGHEEQPVLGDGELEYSLKDHDNEFDESDDDFGMNDHPSQHDLHDDLSS